MYSHADAFKCCMQEISNVSKNMHPVLLQHSTCTMARCQPRPVILKAGAQVHMACPTDPNAFVSKGWIRHQNSLLASPMLSQAPCPIPQCQTCLLFSQERHCTGCFPPRSRAGRAHISIPQVGLISHVHDLVLAEA